MALKIIALSTKQLKQSLSKPKQLKVSLTKPNNSKYRFIN